jgi:hypothetical protein
MNRAISTRWGAAPGIVHLGIQVEDGTELQEVYSRLKQAEGPPLEEAGESTAYETSMPRAGAPKPAAKAAASAGACRGPTAPRPDI